ncbi:MAG: response regulator [PVC group bacterium]|nr:response regulator [PVC group bacterium]
MAKILVVDDDMVIRDLFKRILTQEGHEVFTAESGEECLEVLAQEGVDHISMVFLDLKMPGIGGENTLDVLKKCYKKLPVIVMSAYGMFCTTTKLVQKGNVAYLNKPFDMEYIKIIVRNKLSENTDFE